MNEVVKLQGDLRSACLTEALAIIKEVGIEELSLREVARRLGVSHQAPYRHFPSRDHLLAEIVDGCFRGFDAHLAQVASSEDARGDLARMGGLYLDYAASNPLEYRLMFGAKLPSPELHPKMLDHGCGAFDQLRGVLGRILGHDVSDPVVTLEAMFVWSTIHGFASIMQTEAMVGLGIPPDQQARVEAHLMARIDAALPGGPAAGG